MSSDKRTLTEELNSVMLEHSLRAPEPGPTIEQVLARVAGGVPGAVRARRTLSDRIGSGRFVAGWLGAAAVVGVVASAAIWLPSHSSPSSKASSATAGVAGLASSAAAASTGSADQRSAVVQGPVDGSLTMPAASASSGSGLCAPDPVVRPESLTVGGSILQVGSYICATGAVGASLVQVTAAGQLQTLIDPSDGLRVESITASENSLNVTALAGVGSSLPNTSILAQNATVAAPGAAQPALSGAAGSAGLGSAGEPAATLPPGSVQQFVFSVSAGVAFGQPSVALVASPCTQSGLKVTVTAATNESTATRAGGSAAAIGVVNETASPCAISGIPTVEAISGTTHTGVQQTLSAPDGGPSAVAAPVVVLKPGGRATAIVQAALGSCGTTSALEISLPRIGAVGQFDYRIGLCSLQVHPLVSGISGEAG